MGFLCRRTASFSARSACFENESTDRPPLIESTYPNKLKLNFTAKDAHTIIKAFQTHSKPLFDKIEVKELTNEKATQREILKGITWLSKQMTQRHVSVVFLAGHGELAANGRFSFMPADVDPDDIGGARVPRERIKATLSARQGRVMFLLDACHARGVHNNPLHITTSLWYHLLHLLDSFTMLTGGSSVTRIVCLLLCSVIGAGPLLAAQPPAKKVDFGRDIRPILANHCWVCHGPDEQTREAGLRLDVREVATAKLKSGRTAIVPGDTSASALIARIDARKDSLRMPPADSKRPLNETQKLLLRRWIEEGAEYKPHWAFVPPKRPAVPVVKHRAWVRNPIDAFILQRLEEEGLQPSPEANRETLLRRVSFDLTGLPPTLEELDRFLNDQSADAYEKAVDRLLSSPRHAERMTVPWLDAARYADTNGYNNDEERTMWPWRDWVINAFHTNMPYDRFILEQLAGDLLPGAGIEQKIATGFNRNHPFTTEGGIFEEEYRVEYVADRVHTTATAFLGLSVQCARCHDHKYDPLTQKEYYRFFAFFNNILDKAAPYNRGLPPEPFIRVPTAENQPKLAKLNNRRQELEQLFKEREGTADTLAANWEKNLTPDDYKQLPRSGMLLHFPLDEGKGTQISDRVNPARKGTIHGKAIWSDGKFGKALEFNGKAHVDLGAPVSFDSGDRFSISAWVYSTSPEPGAVVSKIDDADGYRGWDVILEENKIACHLIHRWPGDGLKVVTKKAMSRNSWHHVLVTYDGSRKAVGVKIYLDGVVQAIDVVKDKLRGSIRTDRSLHLGKRQQSEPFQGKIDEVQFFSSDVGAEDAKRLAQGQPVGDIAAVLALASSQRSEQQKTLLTRYYLEAIDPVVRKYRAELAELDQQKASIDKSNVAVMVMAEMMPARETFVLKRGQYDQRGEKVSAGVPAMLPPLPKGASANRLGLAKWLVDPAHPLTARVAVNRWWAMYFGTGLVETVEDLGLQGGLPSHPELLDWLAVEFVSPSPPAPLPPGERGEIRLPSPLGGEGPGVRGWNVKAMQKLIVTSATYRQSSRTTKELLQRDPKNRLLARAPRLRLTSEMLRDNALAVSGLLKEKVGGPSVKPYQPPGLWEDVSVERRYKYVPDKGDNLYRRSMYTFWRRTCPPPSMLLFDAPDRETCLLRRARTNTPLHALVVLNDPTYIEAARKLAERVMQKEKTVRGRITMAYRLTLARTPTEKEQGILAGWHQEVLEKYREDATAVKNLLNVGESSRDTNLNAAELAAWSSVMHLIFNLDEMLTKG